MHFLDDEKLVGLYEKSDGPLFLPSGERFVYARPPEGARVLYPRPAFPGWSKAQLREEVKKAIDSPLGMEPLKAHLKPGAKVTIAVDDISLSLPIQVAPDVRQIATEVILERLAEAGIDDIHIVIAVCLHRHMLDWEVKQMLGAKIFNAHWHKKTLYNYDAEDKDDNVVLGHTDHKEVVEIHKRSATSDLLIYVNLNLVALNGGHKSVGVGLATYKCIRPNHCHDAQFNSRSFNDPPRSKMHKLIDRIGRFVEKEVKVFHLEMTVNNDMYPGYLNYMMRSETTWSVFDKAAARVNKHALDCTPLSLNRKIFFANKAPYAATGVTAGEAEAVHAVTLKNLYKQQLIEIQGQCDILVVPIPYVMPYSVHSVMNPILVYAMGLGYMFNFYMGQPVLKQGGSIIFLHQMEHKFDARFHPSYIELWERLKETRDPRVVDTWADELAAKPEYIHKYRYENAYHGFHAVSMWNWGCHGYDHSGQVIAVNPVAQEVPQRLGWEVAPSVERAVEMAKAKQGANASVTVLHTPPISMWKVN